MRKVSTGRVRLYTPIFPCARILQPLPLLGKGRGLAHQPPVHLLGGQVGTGRVRTQPLPYLFRVLIDDLDRDPCQVVPRTRLDHLEVVPIGLGLLVRRALARRTRAPVPRS
jgi:hypothetical protein